MKQQLSILIPTYNDDCYDLVASLVSQANSIEELQYEIIVADDASSMTRIIMSNRRINDFPYCRLVENAVNRGRAKIRNNLMGKAKYDWLLFIDSDMTIVRDNFLQAYLSIPDEVLVAYGGYEIIGDDETLNHNLRYRYERKHVKAHAAEQRALHPDYDFHTSNFLIARQLMERSPLDERFEHYGYEDVLYGRQLCLSGVNIHHIDNPVGFGRFEDNTLFIKKTEESLRTLLNFKTELNGYSRLLDFTQQHPTLTRWILRLYRHHRKSWKKNLCGTNPSLRLFQLYKLGYYARLEEKQNSNK